VVPGSIRCRDTDDPDEVLPWFYEVHPDELREIAFFRPRTSILIFFQIHQRLVVQPLEAKYLTCIHRRQINKYKFHFSAKKLELFWIAEFNMNVGS
jgi:hypothetical protein